MHIPLGNRVCVRRLAVPPDHTSMFSVPQDSREKPQEVEVVAVPAEPYVSEFGQVIQCPVRPGDRALVGKYTAGEIRTKMEDGSEEDLLYLRWEELLAVERPLVGAIQPDSTTSSLTTSLPSADDLDRVAEEEEAREQTGGADETGGAAGTGDAGDQ